MMERSATIMGAIIGDTIGSAYEFNPTKDYNFPLYNDTMNYTDDSIMTIAVADWILNDESLSPMKLIHTMRYYGNKYNPPKGGYGHLFSEWLRHSEIKAYNSWGNGSAMRVSAIGFAFPTLDKTLKVAEISAAVTHNHPEGIKGAQATAAAIFLARKGESKETIRKYITETFGYNLSRTCEEIRPTYQFEASCQETVPQAIVAFLDSKDYLDAIRLGISLGGDADTIAAITGAIAAAFYKKVPSELYDRVLAKLPKDLEAITLLFEAKVLA